MSCIICHTTFNDRSVTKCIWIIFIFFLSLQLGFAVEKNESNEIIVVSEGWHTGIIIKTSFLPDSIHKKMNLSTSQSQLDFSFGEKKYYQHPTDNFFLAIRAALIPTPGVIKVSTLRDPIHLYYGDQALYDTINLNTNQLKELTSFIIKSFSYDENDQLIPSRLKGFYESSYSYHLFMTCNTWAGKAFKQSGVPISTFLLINNNQLFKRLD